MSQMATDQHYNLLMVLHNFRSQNTILAFSNRSVNPPIRILVHQFPSLPGLLFLVFKITSSGYRNRLALNYDEKAKNWTSYEMGLCTPNVCMIMLLQVTQTVQLNRLSLVTKEPPLLMTFHRGAYDKKHWFARDSLILGQIN